MTPEKSEQILRAVLGSIRLWVWELEEIERCCPAKVVHLAASMRQAERSLQQLIERDEERE